MIGYPRISAGWYPSWIEVAGFKSIRTPTRIELRPLTLLAGTNSSGKSSIFQPLLLIKQSLEAPYDPDPLLLDGPHLSITSLDQVLSRGWARTSQEKQFHVAFGAMRAAGPTRSARRKHTEEARFEVKLIFRRKSKSREGLHSSKWIRRAHETAEWIPVDDNHKERLLSLMGVSSSDAELQILGHGIQTELRAWPLRARGVGLRHLAIGAPVEWTRGILHLPGYRGHRERRFPLSKVSRSRFGSFSVIGPMPPYSASLLLEWKRLMGDGVGDGVRRQAREHLKQVAAGMKKLGLTWKVTAVPANAAELELRVGRLPEARRGGAQDLVDIADVGFGLSQVLPVLVALVAAVPGQMVLVEQPELHLHPSAQLAMGRVLADAAKRGVIVVIETHSQLILRAIQTIVATGYLTPEHVGLNWFSRDNDSGWTTVTQADLKKDGTFGDWPVDFPNVYSMADAEFIDAVFANGGPL